ncbi:ribokinase [Candidatus Neomarinimicrobiota bacterium]
MKESYIVPKVAVIGSINMDIVVCCPRLPKEGESLLGSDLHLIPGGKGANQAVTAARLGSKTSIAGCVGDDVFGVQLMASLEQSGVNVSQVRKDSSVYTGTAIITVLENGNNSIVVAIGANETVTPEDVDSASSIIQDSDVLLLQLEIPLDTVAYAEKVAREMGVKVILDTGPARNCPKEIIEGADIVSPNETEIEAITGHEVNSIDSAKSAANALIEIGAEEVVLKLGSNGSLWARKGIQQHFPAVKVDPVDPTAAGDAFTGALAVRLASGDRMEDAIRYANFAGAFSVTKLGAQPSVPELDELEEFIRENW